MLSQRVQGCSPKGYRDALPKGTRMLSQRVQGCSPKGYKDALLKGTRMLSQAGVFLSIFEQTSPLSKYFQTSGMDIVTALGDGNGG
jgi:hypothetical protein